MLWNPERIIHISGILLIVEDKDLIFLLFQGAAVFTDAQERPAMTNC